MPLQEARRSFNTTPQPRRWRSPAFRPRLQEQASRGYRPPTVRHSPRERQASWARFVYAASDIAHHGQAVEDILGLREPERAAWRFFQQIADENADLLCARAGARQRLTPTP